jgi:hypothetical protein
MAIPHDNFEDLVDHLRDARTKCIDTVEWLDNQIVTETPCPVVALSKAIDRLMCEAILVAQHLSQTIPQ